MLRPLSVLLCALALVLAACGDDDSASRRRRSEAAQAPAAEPTGRLQGRRAAAAARRMAARRSRRSRSTAGKTYDVDADTSCGDITIRLDQKTSPHAAASFAALARSGFFDDTVFHRIVPGFVIQGGDPTGERHRRPRLLDAGWRPPPTRPTAKGVVAMAKTGNEPPGTAGSQFYIVTGAERGAARPTTRCSARSRRAWTWCRRSASSATRPAAAPARRCSPS